MVFCSTPEQCLWLELLLKVLFYPVVVLAVFTLFVIINEGEDP
jgi:hypothetical protein